jgi:hypothetical protein
MEAVVEMESSACVPQVGSLASRARNDGKMRALFCAQLGKNKIHSIELALFRARGKYLIANALTYSQPATAMRDMLLICRQTAQRVAVFGYSILQLTAGMRQGSPSLGCSVRCAHTRDVIGGIHLPRLKMMEAEPPELFPIGKRRLHPQKCFFTTRTVNGMLLNHTP